MGRPHLFLRLVFAMRARCTLLLGMVSHLTHLLARISSDRRQRHGSFWTPPSPFLSSNLHGYLKTWP
jgi:hypothetical protein